MNIVLVIDQYDDGNNGTTVTARRFAGELRKLGHRVTILAGGEPAENKICAPVHKIPIFERLIESQGMRFAKPDDKAYFEAFHDADIIHFYMPFRFCRRGEELARQLHVPTIAAFHTQPENITSSIGLGKNKSVNRFLYWMFYRWFYNRFRQIHCPSAFIAEQLKEHGYDAELCVISNGVDDIFVPRPEVKAKRDPDKIWKILMIGRLSGEKRQDLIIEAAKRSKYRDKIQLYFAGQGPKEAEYRRLSKGLAREPVFSFYPAEELVELINSCDLYVHSSDAEIEGISCMEALACGVVPVISDAALSATKKFALDERSLFAAGDPDDLARKMDYWFEHPEERLKMEEAYAKSGEQMRVSACVRQAEQMYHRAIEDFQKNGYKQPKETGPRKLTHPKPEKINRKYAKHSRLRRILTTGFTNFLALLLVWYECLFMGLSIKGRKRLRGVKGGAVTVCNHVHPMDCTMVKIALFPRLVRYISLRRNLELPFTGWLIKACGVLPLPDHPVAMARFQRELERGIEHGEWVHYYPEGMLVKYGENVRPFRPGAFVTAVRADCPVIPLRIRFEKPHGIRSLWRKKPFPVLEINDPLYPDPALPRREAIRDLTERTFRVTEGGRRPAYTPQKERIAL